MEPEFDMEGFIRDKLADMQNLEQKELLRDMMEAVFIPMYRQTEAHYNNLKRRVRDELPAEGGDFAVYTSIMSERELGIPHSFLRPMLARDTKPGTPALNSITEQLVLDTFFCEISYPEFRDKQSRAATIKGVIQTDKGDIEADFAMRPSRRYIDPVCALYRTFQVNQIPWRTLCSPLLFHFYDIVPVRTGRIPIDAAYIGYSAGGLHEYAPSAERKVPVWNMETISAKCKSFPEPAIDHVNYEHEVDMQQLPAGSYLAAPSGDVLFARREKGGLIIVSPQDKQLTCDICRVLPFEDLPTNKLDAPLFGNGVRDSFAGRMSARFGRNVKTKGEIQRLVNSMGAGGRYLLRDIKVLHEPYSAETYEVNAFIKDEVRDMAVSKSLALTFERKREPLYYDHDLISYYCSAVQQVFPEYSVQGALLESGGWTPRESGEGLPV